jgi:hypothetical protein
VTAASTSERCADLSEVAREPLGATASTTEHWLLVEVAGIWQRDVARGAGLAESTRLAVGAWLDATPSSRLLFVRRPGRTRTGSVAFVVRAGEERSEVRRIELSAPDELADVDLASAGEPSGSGLVLVCGHGTRDPCCALRGTALYGTLAPGFEDERIWLSSHQGGHRFAANVLVLPGGIQLGRVTVRDAARLVGRALSGLVDLEHYRGRVVYTADVQAAERAVREELALERLDDLRLVSVDENRVVFVGPDGRVHAAVVDERPGPPVPASCGAAPEPQRLFSARIV